MTTPIETRVYDRAEIEIDVLFPMVTTKLTQVFVNPGNEIIEAIYQFPVPSEAVLGDVEVKINHERYTGKIESAYQAESDYETGVLEGKRSVLVKKLNDGLMEVNAGNLAPEDEISITLTIHALLERENLSARYHLPTCIAPRYGKSDLDEFHTPYNNLFAAYPFTGHIQIHGNADIEITDATHALTHTSGSSHGQAKSARFKGELNQDISIQMRLASASSVAYQVAHNNTFHTLASFIPANVDVPEQAANLQLVVDCSGSMGGRSIAQVREGLKRAIEVFNKEDRLNLVRFGSGVKTLHNKPAYLSGRASQQLDQAIDALEANLGGTEIIAALESAIAQYEKGEAGDILMLTDGQVWGSDQALSNVIATAKERGIRIFCIGVGDNIDDAFLTKLAHGTDAQLRRVNPHENMARVVASAVTQIRRSSVTCRTESLGGDSWHNELTSCLAGEHPTTMSVSPTPRAVCALETVTTEGVTGSENNTVSKSELQVAVMDIPKNAFLFERPLVQLIANERLHSADKDIAEQIAREAEIISEYTSYVMVSDQVVEGADGLPQVAHLPQSAPRSMMDYQDSVRFRMGSYDRSERLMESCRSVMIDSLEDRSMSYEEYSSVELPKSASLEQLIASLHLDLQLDLALLEKLLDRRKHKDQNIDFSLLSMCGVDEHKISQLQEAYYDLLDDDAEITEEQFVAALIQRFVAEQGYTLKPAVAARLNQVIGEFEL